MRSETAINRREADSSLGDNLIDRWVFFKRFCERHRQEANGGTLRLLSTT